MNLKNKKVYAVLSVIILASILTAGTFLYNQTNKASAEYPKEPYFAFGSDSQEWWTSGNYSPRREKSDTGELLDETLPVSSITIHHAKDEEDIINEDCFMTVSYYDHSADPTAELKEMRSSTISSRDDISIRETGVQATKIHIAGSIKNFLLYKHKLVGGSTQNLMNGLAFGYVELGNSHVKVQGVCKDASQLDTILPALESVRLSY